MQKYLHNSKKSSTFARFFLVWHSDAREKTKLFAFSPNDQMVNGEMVNGMVPSYNG